MIGLGTHLSVSAMKAVPSGAVDSKIYADFVSGEYFVDAQQVTVDAFLSCTRTSSGRLYTGNAFAANIPRIGVNGLLVEEERTNHFCNSNAPVTQTLSLAAGNYVASVKGLGNVALSDGASGVAVASSPVQFTLVSTATVTCTTSGALDWVQVENGLFPTSPIATTTGPETRNSDVIQLLDPSILTPQNVTVTIEWEQLQSGSFAQNGVNNLLRWDTPEGWSRLRAGSVAFAQIASTQGGLALNKGASVATPVGIHVMQLVSSSAGLSISWSSTLTGTAGLGSTANVTWPSVPFSVQLGGADESELLNGYIRKLVIA